MQSSLYEERKYNQILSILSKSRWEKLKWWLKRNYKAQFRKTGTIEQRRNTEYEKDILRLWDLWCLVQESQNTTKDNLSLEYVVEGTANV